MPVSESLSIGSTSTGVNFDQIWVHNIAGGQSDVYSNRANFSVTCSAPGSLPRGESTYAVLGNDKHLDLYTQPNLQPPTDISTSGDPSACAAHIANPFVAGLLCQPIAAANKLFILWRCASCPSDVDGFKIYLTDVSGVTGTLLDKTSAGPGATVSLLSAPAGGFAGKCYAVTSYKGSKESAMGYRSCISVAPTVGTTSVTLQSVHVRSSTRSDSNVGGAYRPTSAPDLVAGYSHDTNKHFLGDTWFNDITRGAFAFDLSPMVGRPLQKATLHLHVNVSQIGANNTSDYSKSCAAEVGAGKDTWWNNTAWIEADWSDNTSSSGPNVDVNVTTDVRSWMNGAANYGFVIKGSDENLKAFTEDKCISRYASPTLTLEYFK